jgi:hypothetical protein
MVIGYFGGALWRENPGAIFILLQLWRGQPKIVERMNTITGIRMTGTLRPHLETSTTAILIIYHTMPLLDGVVGFGVVK